MERTEWVNIITSQLWPYLDKFLRNILQHIEEDQELNKRLQGYHIKAIKFPNFSLGKIPPRLSGIKFQEGTANQK